MAFSSQCRRCVNCNCNLLTGQSVFRRRRCFSLSPSHLLCDTSGSRRKRRQMKESPCSAVDPLPLFLSTPAISWQPLIPDDTHLALSLSLSLSLSLFYLSSLPHVFCCLLHQRAQIRMPHRRHTVVGIHCSLFPSAPFLFASSSFFSLVLSDVLASLKMRIPDAS